MFIRYPLMALLLASPLAGIAEEGGDPKADIEMDVEVEVEDPELTKMRTETERLEAAEALRQAQLTAELAQLQQQTARLEAELSLAQQQASKERLAAELEKQQLDLAASLRQAHFEKELAETRMENQRLQLQAERLNTDLLKATTQSQKLQIDFQDKSLAMQLQAQQRQEALASIQQERAELEAQLANYESRRRVQNVAKVALDYPAEPFKDGLLRVSDRRITLDFPIIGKWTTNEATGEWVAQRIEFFNNQDPEAPIFIVIESCPGGSIMEGNRIVQAMQASKAPIHAVVTKYAASMAAVILAEADHSYAFEHAIVLHHQPMSGNGGNVSQQRQWLKTFEQWGHRLHKRTAERMGITVEELWKQCYEKSVDGDWLEFGDAAQKLAWVDHVVDDMIEEGAVYQKPQSADPLTQVLNQADGTAMPTAIQLPPLAPFDGYFLYDPKGQYRIQ